MFEQTFNILLSKINLICLLIRLICVVPKYRKYLEKYFNWIARLLLFCTFHWKRYVGNYCPWLGTFLITNIYMSRDSSITSFVSANREFLSRIVFNDKCRKQSFVLFACCKHKRKYNPQHCAQTKRMTCLALNN